MPSIPVHCKIDTLLFGQSYPSIHQDKDRAFSDLGLSHRIVGHDPFYNLLTPFPPSAFAHDIADLVLLPLSPIALAINPRLVLD